MSGPLSLFSQVVLLAALGGGAYFGWQEQDRVRGWFGIALAQDNTVAEKRRERGGAPVILAPVGMAADTLRLEAVGTGFAVRSITLRAETAGRVASSEIEADRGHRAGDVLLQLDDSNERLAVRLAIATFRDAERTRARQERLQQTGVSASSALDEATTASEVARIEVERARDALADRALRAPFDGISGLPGVEPGDWVESGEAVATYDDRSALLVEFDLPEALLSRVTPGLTVAATSPSVPGRRFAGRVAAIDSRIDAGNRAARARVTIPNDADLLRPGASFTIELSLDGATYPVVPELALQFSRGSLYVWRIVDGTAERVEVEMMRRRSGTVLVDGPLRPGDRVVVEGTQRLSDGRTVDVLDSGGGS